MLIHPNKFNSTIDGDSTSKYRKTISIHFIVVLQHDKSPIVDIIETALQILCAFTIIAAYFYIF